MRITTKILFLCVFLVGGTTITAGIGLSHLHRLEEILQHMANVDLKLTRLAGTIVKHQWEKAVLVERWTRVAEEWEAPDLSEARRRYLRDVIRQVRAGLKKIAEDNAEAIVQAKALLDDAAARGLFSPTLAQRIMAQMALIEQKHIDYDRMVFKTFDDFEASQTFIAPLTIRRINRLQQELSEHLAQTQSILNLQAQLRLDQARRQVQSAWMFMHTAWLILLLGGVVVSWWIILDIKDPLRRLIQAADQIGQGRFDITLPVGRKKDEIAEVSRAFLIMSRRLQELTQELREKNQRLENQLSAIKAQKQELERVTKELDLLISIIGHDLRSPTMALVWYAENLKKSVASSFPEKDRHLFDRLFQAIEKLKHHLEEVLNYSKWVRMKGRWEQVDLNQVMRDVLGSLGLMIERHHAQIVGPEQWPTLCTDRMKIREIFLNLISNAVKYSAVAGRRPKIVLSWDQTPDQWIFRVADNGIGIPEEEQPYIFDMFHRGSHSMDSDQGGHGAGLAIVKALVEAHGGEIRLESRVGEGTVFTIVIPKHPPVLEATRVLG